MNASVVTLAEINRGNADAFVAMLGDAFENSPWLVARATAKRPFSSRDDLIAALLAILKNADPEEQLALIRAHPDLAGKAARAGALTASSTREQASVGLDQLSAEEFDRFSRLNADYQQKFGFPFIIAVRDHTKQSILDSFVARLNNDRAAEIDEAVSNIARIVSLRITDTVEG